MIMLKSSRQDTMNIFYSTTIEELACAVLKAAGESLERKHVSYLGHLEALLEIHLVVDRENVNQEQQPSSELCIDTMDDGYEVTLLEEYAPFDVKSKPQFYPALSALLCECFQPGCVLSYDSSNSTPAGLINTMDDNSLFQYSLLKNDLAVRCATILHSLIVKLPEDVFSLSTLIHATPFIASDQNTKQRYFIAPSTTLLASFVHHITALPEIEARVHALQRRARNTILNKSNDPIGRLTNVDSFSERLDLELAAHVETISAKLLTALYRYSDPLQRKIFRTKIGAILYSFALHSSSLPQMSSIVSSSTSSLGERNTSAAAIPGMLLSLYRIISGFRAPPLHDSHRMLLLHILLPLHKTNAMVLWRDQTPMLELYHEPLVMCISKILDFDTETSPPLVSKVILALLHPKMWPEGRTSNTPKVVLLLHEIDTLLERHPRHSGADLSWFQSIASSLILRICECISGDNSRVSERALQMWRNDKFEALVGSQLSTYLSPLLRALCRINTNMEPSWNPTVNKMTALVIRKLEERDSALFVRVCNELMGSFKTGSDDIAYLGKQDLLQQQQPQPQPQPQQDAEHVSQVTVQLPDFSLKSAMGAWKPPPRRKPGTPVTSKSSGVGTTRSIGTPPSTVTGVAPWAVLQRHGSSSISSSLKLNNQLSVNPPLTVTGVAPWAMSGGADRNISKLNSLPRAVNSSTAPSNIKRSLDSSQNQKMDTSPIISEHVSEDGLVELELEMDEEEQGSVEENQKLMQATSERGIVKLREFMNKISPQLDDGTVGESDSSNDYSSWAAAQLSESPLLLPGLKFHDLVFGHELGSGAFSTVKYARRIIKNITRSSWPEYAVKIISTSKIQELGYEASVNREIAILRTLSHPGIARLVSSFRFQDGAYLVLEYASKGDLHDLLRKNGSLDHDSTRFVMGEVVAALQSVHDAGFVYGDLKPENILITESGHVKLTDFGACRPVTDSAKQLIKTSGHNAICQLRDGNWKITIDDRCNSKETENRKSKAASTDSENDNRIEGTTAYLPPEVAMGGIPTSAADSWALGCVLYQCISGKPPILGDTEEQTIRKIVAFQLEDAKEEEMFFGHQESSAFRPETKALVRSLLNLDMKERLSVFAIARHDFFTGMDISTLYKGNAPALMQGSFAPTTGDTKWTRRQFSSIWAPQPKAYLLGVSSSRYSTTSCDASVVDQAVEEGLELDASFVPKTSSVHTLSKIKELFA